MRNSVSSAQGMLATVIGLSLAGGGLYLLSEEISGNLVPLAYFAMIGLGAAAVVRGLHLFRRDRS